MKKRLIAVALGMSTLFSLAGCSFLHSGDQAVRGDLDFGGGSTNIDNTVDSPSGDNKAEEKDKDTGAENGAMDGIFVYRFSSSDNLFFTEDEQFYEDFLRASVDARLQVESLDGTIGDVASVWTSRIKDTAETIRNTGKLTDEQKELLDSLISNWDDYDPRCRNYYSSMFGTGSSFMLGSMYTEMMPDQLFLEYQIFEGVLMSIERELTGTNELNLSVLTEDQDISDITVHDFDDRCVCMEGGPEFEERASMINLDEMGEMELLWYAAVFNDEIGLMDENDAASPYSVNYVFVANRLGNLGGSVTGDSQKKQNYFETITKLRTVRMLDAYLLLDASDIEYAGYIDEEQECYRIAVKRTSEVEGEYSHLRDYFYMDGAYVNVDYPSKSDDMHSDRYVFDACDFEAELVDVTLDGNKDLIISLGHQGAAGTQVHCAYVYENGRYVYRKSFESIPNYGVTRDGTELFGLFNEKATSYVYENGEFVEGI